MSTEVPFDAEFEALEDLESSVSHDAQRRYLLHAMDVFEQSRNELGNYTVTIGKGKDRLVVLAEPIVTEVELTNKEKRQSVTFIALSQRGFYSLQTSALTWSDDWTKSLNFMNPGTEASVIVQINKAINGDGKVKGVKLGWKRQERGQVPNLKLKNSDGILSLPIIRTLTGYKKFIGETTLSPVDAELGIAQIRKVKERVLGYVEAKTSRLEVVEDEAHDFADEAGVPFDKEKRKRLNDEE